MSLTKNREQLTSKYNAQNATLTVTTNSYNDLKERYADQTHLVDDQNDKLSLAKVGMHELN